MRRLELLDLACGNSSLSRRFARESARVSAVDASAPVVRLARAREPKEPLGIRSLVGDARRLDRLESGGFDVVVSDTALRDIRDADRAIGEVGRRLRPSGRFVFSICHPCFDVRSRSAGEIEYRAFTTVVSRKVRRYREPYEEPASCKVGDGAFQESPGFPRPHSWYVTALGDAGLVVERFEAPAPRPEMFDGRPQAPFVAEVPLHRVLGARRLADGAGGRAVSGRGAPGRARRARDTARR